MASGNPSNLPDARLPIWQRRSGTATAINTWTNADQYGTSRGSDCTLVDPGATTQAPLPAGVSTGPLGLTPNVLQRPYPDQGIPAFGSRSKLIGMASGPVLNPLDGQPIKFDAYSTYLRVLNAFQIGGTAWPGADTHKRVSPGGLRDLGALEQLQFQSILTRGRRQRQGAPAVDRVREGARRDHRARGAVPAEGDERVARRAGRRRRRHRRERPRPRQRTDL